jgi:hypothetical protein
MKNIIYPILIILVTGCETTIHPELDEAEEIIVVDAWINQKMERQEIKVTRSQPYFENSYPEKIPNATVFVEDLNTGDIYNFQEDETSYFWEPTDEPFGIVGNQYKLTVVTDGETFEATSRLGRVPEIDSVLFHYNTKDIFVKEEYYTAEFVASDPVGRGDTYWIKSFKNGEFLSKPDELNMAYDASFSSGQNLDGQLFVAPIRQVFLNPYDENPDKSGEFYPPYLAGDSVAVEIHSINPLAYQFLWEIYFYMSRPGGFAELFATPLANPITNLKSINANSTTNIAGFFNTAAVSVKGRKLTQELADQLKQNGGN